METKTQGEVLFHIGKERVRLNQDAVMKINST